MNLLEPKCCDRSSGTVLWSEKDKIMGPDKAGWCFRTMIGSFGPYWYNVSYCPFCGKKLKRLTKTKELVA